MLTAISLFSGVGGLDYGFHEAGFRTAVSIEHDPICCATMRLNGSWPILEGDINSFSSQEILETARLKKGEADILIGGPPCQPFSKSSYWVKGDSGRLDDPRANTLTAYLRVLKDTQPKCFLLENVKGLAYQGKATGLQHLLDGIEEINKATKTDYKVSWKVLNAAEYGVPQLRERIFLVGSRDGQIFEFPKQTHGEGLEEGFRTAWDAIGDLKDETHDFDLTLKGKWAELLKSIPEGKNYLWHTPRGGGKPLFGWRTRYWNFLLKLAKAQPSWTLQASPGPSTGPFHWENRMLSPKEMSRLQTLPENLVFSTSYRNIQRMVGNAVPSLLAEVLATEIREQLLNSSRNTKSYSLLREKLKKTPKENVISPVDPLFAKYFGDHRDHAGPGMGPRALVRNHDST